MTEFESHLRTRLERLAPLPEGSRLDWRDVLHRAEMAGRPRRRSRVALVLAAATACALLLLFAAPALGIRPLGSVFGDEPTPTWSWPEGVPGDPTTPPKLLVDMNETANGRVADPVDIKTVRQIVSAGSGHAEGAFYAARGLNGDVCLTKLGGGGNFGTPFSCLHDPARKGVPTMDSRAMVTGMSSGGHRGSVVDYATLIGVVRADVGRVELTLANGQTIELPLNRWRGFGYSATDPSRFPKTLSVYRSWSSFFRHHQKLVEQLPLQQLGGLEPTPLCGGSYGACPEGVTP